MKKILTMMIALLSFSAMAESKNCQIQVDLKLENWSKEEIAKITMIGNESVDKLSHFSYNMAETLEQIENEKWKVSHEGSRAALHAIEITQFNKNVDTLNIQVNSHINISHGIGFSQSPLEMKATSPINYTMVILNDDLAIVDSGIPYFQSTSVTVDCR